MQRTPEEQLKLDEEKEQKLARAIENRKNQPRSIFYGGSRIYMNIIPVLLNVLAPWVVFIFCCGLTSFSVMYTARPVAYALLAAVTLLWLILLFHAIQVRRHSPDPTWWSYTALAMGVAIVSGTACGLHNFATLSRPYYEIRDLKVINQLHVGSEQGQNFMDAGIVFFAKDSQLDRVRSWHFKRHNLYCVAPIVDPSMQTVAEGDTPSFDFWAVGEDCCSHSSSDFRCGSWDSARARSAVRVLDDDVIPYYRLAVQQAETLYGVVAAHPIFFRWSEDPLAEVNSWSTKVFRRYLFMVASALVVSMLLASITTCRYSLIGRKGSRRESLYEYDAGWGDFYDDSKWRSGVTSYHNKYGSM